MEIIEDLKSKNCIVTSELLSAMLDVWPEHQNYVNKSFAARDESVLQSTELISQKIKGLVGDKMKVFCQDYRWTCEKLLEEELHFRRHGEYRFSKLSDVIDQVYNDNEYMKPYLNGLLLSQVFWGNHTHVFDYYLKKFLPLLPDNTDHLEIGPGHGLFLYFAAEEPNVSTITGWDISPTSIQETGAALDILKVQKSANLNVVDMMETSKDDGCYDSIVLSEILEHIENPILALSSLKKNLSANGHVFINVPINSPAPDHIYLLKTPEEAVEMVETAGYQVMDKAFFPAGGYSLEKARKNDLTVSCAIIAKAK